MRRIIKFLWITLPTLIVDVPIVAAQSNPTLNCAITKRADELTICASPELSKLERELNVEFEKVRLAIGMRASEKLRDTVLFERAQCHVDVNCLKLWFSHSKNAYISASIATDQNLVTIQDLAESVLKEGFRCSAPQLILGDKANSTITRKHQNTIHFNIDGFNLVETITILTSTDMGIFTHVDKSSYRAKWAELDNFVISAMDNAHVEFKCNGNRDCILETKTKLRAIELADGYQNKPEEYDNKWRKGGIFKVNAVRGLVCDANTANLIVKAGNELVRLRSTK